MHFFLRDLRLGHVPKDAATAFPFTIPAIKNLGRLELHPGVTFFVGENGSGKSTLIEALAIKAGFNAEGGTKNFWFAARPSESNLSHHLVVWRGVRRERGGFFLRAETMFNVSTEAEAFREYGWDDLHAKSHGEAFLWVIENRFGPQSLFILDEPEAALSPQRQLALLGLIHKHVKRGCQFVIATHSPILMAYPQATIYCLDGDGINPIEYKLTEHYAVTKAFLLDPARMLNGLLAAGEADEEEE